MRTFDFARILGGTAIVSLFAVHGALANNSGHFDQFSCYASIQIECYGNGEVNCTEDEYAMGLGWCDESYPSTGRPSTPAPGGLAAVPGGNQGGFVKRSGRGRR